MDTEADTHPDTVNPASGGSPAYLSVLPDSVQDGDAAPDTRDPHDAPCAALTEGAGDAPLLPDDGVCMPAENTPEDMYRHVRMAEALLFAAAEPLDEATLAGRLPSGADIRAVMDHLEAHYRPRGIRLERIDGRWRFVTAQDVAHVLTMERSMPRRLSKAALETLAIIAYHQPCTRAGIEEIRGVQVSRGSLDQLMEIGWVRLRGRRKDVPGRPVLYGTSRSFLEHFGLESIRDLPGLEDLKAAGLLDARLPPGFSVPLPDADAHAGDDESGEEETEEYGEDGDESALT